MFNYILSAKHVTFYFVDSLILCAKLLSNDLRLLRKRHLTMLFGRFNNLVHGLQPFLDLLHQSALTFESKPLIRLELVDQS